MLHRVVLDVDAELLVASEEHQADLIREFQLISFQPDSPTLPGRLAELIVETLRDYQGTQEDNLAAAHAALADGERTVHLEMELPAEVVPAVRRVLAALEEADAFCQRGDGLLTPASPPEIAAVRRWFVDELARQIDESERLRAPAAGG